MMSYISAFSHDYVNNIEVLDAYFTQYFQALFDEGLLENTALIVFGDHGNRLDDIW
jgi:arylsulfatase A-like enzyme